ncbi:MAG: hypothetical protein PHR20_05880 [Bacteroidales bacterium]|nr:hypothetical protein [Bacteroidales bacterium]
MKRILLLSFAVLSGIAIVSCNGKGKQTNSASDYSEKTTVNDDKSTDQGDTYSSSFGNYEKTTSAKTDSDKVADLIAQLERYKASLDNYKKNYDKLSSVSDSQYDAFDRMLDSYVDTFDELENILDNLSDSEYQKYSSKLDAFERAYDSYEDALDKYFDMVDDDDDWW